jgi:hypothetical protein
MGPFRRRPVVDPAASDDVVELRVPRITNKELLEWGMPSRCPDCNSRGYLDRIDLVAEVIHQHCPSCWTRWIVTKEEIEVSAAPGAPPPQWT